MTTDVEDFAWFCDLSLGVELTAIGDNLSFGIPIYYYITFSGRDSLIFHKTIAEITVDWWDPVPLHKVRLWKTTPAVGLSLKYGSIKFQGVVQGYSIISEDYAGVDRYGARNTARVIDSETIQKGLGWRFDVRFTKWNWGIYYERNGSRVNQVGLLFSFPWY